MNSIRSKIEQYTNESDPELVDFIISLHKDSTTYKSFQEALNDMAGEDAFDEQFTKELYGDIKMWLMREKIKDDLKNKKVKADETKMEDAPTIKMEEVIKQESVKLNIEKEGIKKENPTNTVNIKKEEQDLLSRIIPVNFQLSINKTYKARITNITSFGAFAQLLNDSSVTGLIHISELTSHRVEHSSEVVKLGQEVWVKVIEIEEPPQQNDRRRRRRKISLSMKDVDQITGEILPSNILPRKNGIKEDEPLGKISGPRLSQYELYQQQMNPELAAAASNQNNIQKNHRKRLTSPERWELRQLISSGAISASDYPELHEVIESKSQKRGNNLTEQKADEDEDEEINVDVKHELPPFMRGLGVDVNIFGQPSSSVSKDPQMVEQGSLTRSAEVGSALAKQRRDLKLKLLREDKDRKLRLKLSKQEDIITSSQEEDVEETDEVDEPISWQQRHSRTPLQFGKRTKLPISKQRQSLPVFAMRDELLQTIKDNQFTVIVGETGSGKTTQLTQYLYEESLSSFSPSSCKMIGCTQPRRVAATSVAKRVSEEMNVVLGQEVGYAVRFDEKCSAMTRIKYMTDGMLQREAIRDPLLSAYDVIMLDEAHERTIATDVLFGLLKEACRRRDVRSGNLLRVIVTSATLDSEKFSQFFNNCPVVKIPGRTYPVEIMFSEEPVMDYLVSCVETVLKIHTEEKTGDILVFLTGQEEIETMCSVLEEKMSLIKANPSSDNNVDDLIILPVYSALPSEMQSRIFEPTPPNTRKVILATNIAETSLTIDGVFYVVDPGFSKLNAYDAKLGMDTLQVRPISKAQANQRSGRAGRTGPGRCYRLYTEWSYQKEMRDNTVPEIQRQNLSNTVLMLKAIGVLDILKFEFMDPPSRESILLSLKDLYYLGAIDSNENITILGKQLVNIPTDPQISKTLIQGGIKFNCSEELLTIFAMITTPNIFHRPKSQQEQANKIHARFKSPFGDHLTLLNVYQMWAKSGYDRNWCEENFIQLRSMNQAKDIRRQLMLLFTKFKYPLVSCRGNTDMIRKALCSGFFKNVAKRSPSSSFGSSSSSGSAYETLSESTTVYIHPGSSLSRSSPQYVIYNTILNTTKEYLVHVTSIDPKWLVEIVPEFFEINGKRTIMRKEQEIIKPLFNRFDNKDQNGWRLTRPFTRSTKKRFRAG